MIPVAPHLAQDILVPVYVQGLQGHGRRQGVAGVGVGMQEIPALAVVGVEQTVDVVGNQHGGHGQPSRGKPFGKAGDVGNDAGMVAGEHGAGAAEAGQDLVRDQVDAALRGPGAQAAQEIGAVEAHAAGPLQDGFDHHRAQARAVFLQLGFQRGPYGRSNRSIGDAIPNPHRAGRAERKRAAGSRGTLRGTCRDRPRPGSRRFRRDTRSPGPGTGFRPCPGFSWRARRAWPPLPPRWIRPRRRRHGPGPGPGRPAARKASR